MPHTTRLSILIAGFLLLAAPAAWACDGLMADMPGCSPGEAGNASIQSTCHEAGQGSMACCVSRTNAAPDAALSAGTDAPLSALADSPRPLGEQVAGTYPRATIDGQYLRWREPARYELFSSYLI